MTLDFTIENGRVATQPFDIKLGDYVMNLSGSTGLDQTIDYSGKIKLPASAGDLAILLVSMDTLGEVNEPPIFRSREVSLARSPAEEAVADKAVSELGKKLGLDSAATGNKEELKEAVKEKAAEKALDFLKKKLK